MSILAACKPGREKLLANEAALDGWIMSAKGSGWILCARDRRGAGGPYTFESDACFATHILKNPATISAPSVNALADQLTDVFITSIANLRLEKPWDYLFFSSDDEQLIQRAKTLERRWLEVLQKKMPRVAKLARKSAPSSTDFSEGFFVHITSLNACAASAHARSGGQRRMLMDDNAPSRSYLKIEEAFLILGTSPQTHETVVDLGAAPGGWSYSALKRGASVIAVDNGPLKGVVNIHPDMRHLKTDALTFRPKTPADWLFCDMIEQPDMILNLTHKWLDNSWCRKFVVNLKIGRTDPIPLIRKIHDPRHGLAALCLCLRTRELYHDRDEITVMGERAN